MSWHMAAAFVLGAVFGSFANVLVHRLPRMILGEPARTERFDLSWPPSHCPHCQSPLKLWHNAPLLSYLWLKGLCDFCQHPIGRRYFAIELVSAILWATCTWHWGFNATGFCWAGFATALLTLAVIDVQTQLLPDDLTQALLWAGLVASAAGWMTLPLDQAVWGAIVGYTALWAVAAAFERVTGQLGMGAGDFKLLAALGAWLGPLALLPVIMLASVSGALVGLWLKYSHRLNEEGLIPFGPFLAFAGGLVAILGIDVIAAWMGWSNF